MIPRIHIPLLALLIPACSPAPSQAPINPSEVEQKMIGLQENFDAFDTDADGYLSRQELKAGKIEFRVEKTGIVHAPMGKVSFGVDKIFQNVTAFMETIIKLKPASSKGIYLKGIAVSTTMGPGIKIDVSSIKDLTK